MVLPKSMRIKGYRCFNYIHKTAYKFNSNLMLLKVAEENPNLLKKIGGQSSSQNCRCALSISNKVSKKSVIRNQLRRALHYHLQERFENNLSQKGKWILISLKPPAINKSIIDLKKECDKLLLRAGFYYA